MILSVVTVVYNNALSIEVTIKSVISQLNSSIEYIIIDGNSSDGTLEIIKKFSYLGIVIVSEPDKGIYDAMNKGISLAKGNWIHFLNSGDELISLPINELAKTTNVDLMAFPVSINKNKILLPAFNLAMNIKNLLPHQGCFYKKNAFLNYNLQYSVFADYHLNLQYYKFNKAVKCFTLPVVANHNTDGVSNNKKSSVEFYNLIKTENGLFWLILSYIFFKLRGLNYRIKSLNNVNS